MNIQIAIGTCLVLTASIASAQQAPTGAPPPEAKALVEAPKPVAEAPKIAAPIEETTATVSAGGQLATGNSRLVAGTANSKLELRRGADGFGASLIANYGEGATPGQELRTTAENVQARIRYDRYLLDQLSVFAIATVRHDRLQGLDMRLNLDPGLKYLFVRNEQTSFWAEAGYDFQYDIRREEARTPLTDAGAVIPGAPLLDKTVSDHSTRLFVGLKHGFNKDVTFTTGLEYLQSFVDSTRYRVNYDALFAAGIGGGFAFGFGFSARYDHAPIPGKKNFDTATTASLIYAYSQLSTEGKAP